MKCSHTGNKVFPLRGIFHRNKGHLFQDKWRLSLNKYWLFGNTHHFLAKPNIPVQKSPVFKGVLSHFSIPNT